EGHEANGCSAAPKCPYCQGCRASNSCDCPIWKREYEVQRVKLTEGISFQEAKKKVLGVEGGALHTAGFSFSAVGSWTVTTGNGTTIDVDQGRSNYGYNTTIGVLENPEPGEFYEVKYGGADGNTILVGHGIDKVEDYHLPPSGSQELKMTVELENIEGMKTSCSFSEKVTAAQGWKDININNEIIRMAGSESRY
ncbi:hypothetical protein BaRGS_00039021, partial [Batillaria attramentaria]